MKTYCVVISYTTEGYLLLLNRAVEPLGFCLPGGGVNLQEESLKTGACREFKEETGVTINEKDLEFIKTDIAVSGKEVHIFKLNYRISISSITLSREHTGYILTDTLEGLPLSGNTKSFLSNEQLYSRLHLESILTFGKYANSNLSVESILQINPGYIKFLIDKGFKFGNDVKALYLKIQKDLERDRFIEESQDNNSTCTDSCSLDMSTYSGGCDADDGEYPDSYSGF